MRVIVLVNAAAGSIAKPGQRPQDIEAALREAGVEVEVWQRRGDELTDAARQAARLKPDAVVAAGGDGTIGAVAAALVCTDVPLGVLPLGTFNHFAKDLGIPLRLPEAAAAIARGAVREIDTAEVNGRGFVNNSSIGLYPHIVNKRDKQMERLGRGKWLAMLAAALSVFRRFPTVRVRVGSEDRVHRTETPFVFVGNNRYDINFFAVRGRTSLSRGELCVYYSHRTGRFGLLRLVVRALFGRLDQAKDFEALCAAEVWIETSKKTLRVAIDGEVTRMIPSLHYRVRPAALKVILPLQQ